MEGAWSGVNKLLRQIDQAQDRALPCLELLLQGHPAPMNERRAVAAAVRPRHPVPPLLSIPQATTRRSCGETAGMTATQYPDLLRAYRVFLLEASQQWACVTHRPVVPPTYHVNTAKCWRVSDYSYPDIPRHGRFSRAARLRDSRPPPLIYDLVSQIWPLELSIMEPKIRLHCVY